MILPDEIPVAYKTLAVELPAAELLIIPDAELVTLGI
jgi:hypothetical protein